MEKSFQISKHKFLELEVDTNSNSIKNYYYNLFNLQISLNEKRDHGGFTFVFTPCRLFSLSIRVYDHRHWDDDNDTWSNHLQ